MADPEDIEDTDLNDLEALESVLSVEERLKLLTEIAKDTTQKANDRVMACKEISNILDDRKQVNNDLPTVQLVFTADDNIKKRRNTTGKKTGKKTGNKRGNKEVNKDKQAKTGKKRGKKITEESLEIEMDIIDEENRANYKIDCLDPSKNPLKQAKTPINSPFFINPEADNNSTLEDDLFNDDDLFTPNF